MLSHSLWPTRFRMNSKCSVAVDLQMVLHVDASVLDARHVYQAESVSDMYQAISWPNCFLQMSVISV